MPPHLIVGDYGLRSLKKYCKLFERYHGCVNPWSSPEIWSQHTSGGDRHHMQLRRSNSSMSPLVVDWFESPAVDTYSFGMIMWEVETGSAPYEGLEEKEVRRMLIEQKLRPMIPEGTDEKLSLLIRRCW